MANNKPYTKTEDTLINHAVGRFINEGKTKKDAFKHVSKELDRTQQAIEMRYYSKVKNDPAPSEFGRIYEPKKESSSFKKKALSQLFDSLPKKEKESFLLEQLSNI